MEHKFWSQQPVSVKQSKRNKYIDPELASHAPPTPYPLPDGFYWSTLDIHDPKEGEELYQLLAEHYSEDVHSAFRFDYTLEFLRWALCVPGYETEWHLAVRHANNHKLYAFISGVPATFSIFGARNQTVIINFLCIHRRLRSKRLAPVLIKEVTRKILVIRPSMNSAIYTGAAELPGMVAKHHYYHRIINVKKMVEVSFIRVPKETTMASYIKLYRVPDEIQTTGLRQMNRGDVPALQQFLEQYHNKHSDLYQVFSEEEVQYYFMPRDNIVDTYVAYGVGDSTNQCKITELVSYYTVHSKVLQPGAASGHASYKGGYAFQVCSSSAVRLATKQLLSDAIILAKKTGHDTMTMLDNQQHNEDVLRQVKFTASNGLLYYYIYNWQCPRVQTIRNSLTLF